MRNMLTAPAPARAKFNPRPGQASG